MLDLLLSHLPTLISALTGGGIVTGLIKAYTAYHAQARKDEAQDHDQDMELSERLESRLSKVEGRLDNAENELRDTRKELAHSRIRRQELQSAIDALVERIDGLLDRLEDHEQITEQERDRMTSVPYISDDSNTDSQQDAATE